ncbi:MAG: hypothetical protein ABIG44_18075 [Planctomycetota bacterium]
MRLIPNNSRTVTAMLRIVLMAGVAAILLLAIGYWPTRILAGSAGLMGMLAGVAVALVGAWAGSLPTLLYISRPAREHPIGILIGLGVRFGVTMGLALAVWLCHVVPEKPLLLWVGIAQCVILGVDVTGLVILLKKAAKEVS